MQKKKKKGVRLCKDHRKKYSRYYSFTIWVSAGEGEIKCTVHIINKADCIFQFPGSFLYAVNLKQKSLPVSQHLAQR